VYFVFVEVSVVVVVSVIFRKFSNGGFVVCVGVSVSGGLCYLCCLFVWFVIKFCICECMFCMMSVGMFVLGLLVSGVWCGYCVLLLWAVFLCWYGVD
jgi:hypothetical protein